MDDSRLSSSKLDSRADMLMESRFALLSHASALHGAATESAILWGVSRTSNLMFGL